MIELTPAHSASRRQRLALTLTMGRVSLLPALVWGVGQARWLALLALFAIVITDVLDGVVARRTGSESARRRIVDAGMDKILIHGACIAMVVNTPSLTPLYLPIAALDAVLVAINVRLVVVERTFICGDGLHRAGSGCVAILGAAALLGWQAALLPVAIVTWIVSYGLAIRYVPVVARVRPHRNAGPIVMLRTGTS